MDSGFSYGDIIVIGAIAAFILLRYRAMLGERSERDDSVRPTPATMSDFERVIQLPSTRLPPPSEKKEELAAQYGSLAEQFIAMRGIDREFAPDEFLQGARMAYEMVITAFSKGDRDTLKLLLSDTIYAKFDAALKEGENSGHRADTTLVAISKATFLDASLKGNTATITVDFLSEQIHLIRDKEGTIIEGNVSQHDHVEDRWVFTRNLSSSNPNWKIIET
jgi:predicted lipid-binding transport protein (Tim44 family)